MPENTPLVSDKKNDKLAFSALLYEVLADLRRDPSFFSLDVTDEAAMGSPLESAA